MIPDEIINQILDRTDIVEIISGYIPLKRAGRNFRANCPFHHEKTPSFMVSPDKQIFHCFGCAAGGNVFAFVMKYERIEFPEAVELMAAKAGIQIPKTQAVNPGARSEAAKIHSANEVATHFYHYTLLKTDPANDAVSYFKKRGIKEETIKKLKLGYAPQGWDAFLNFAGKKGFDPGFLQRAGLTVTGKDGNSYDRFRHRVIFPIHDNKGKIVGFGARVLDEAFPKYVNSPQTPVYNKGNNLYGLNWTAQHIREKDSVIIVEGYMDFLMPFQAGVDNIVASLGTALTVEQVKLLKRFTKNIVMVFDPDTAGESASLRGLDIAVSESLNVKVATLPQGFDPDRMVKEQGVEKFKECIDKSIDFFDYKYNVLKSKHKGSDINSKAKIAGEMLLTIAKVSNAVSRSEYVKKLAQYMDIDPQALWAEIKKIKPGQDTSTGVSLEISDSTPSSGVCINVAEKMLLGFALEDFSFIEQIRKHLNVRHSENDEFNILLGAVCDFWGQHKNINIGKLVNSIKDQRRCRIILDAYASTQEVTDKDKCFKDCIKNIKQTDLKFRLKALQAEIARAHDLKTDEESLNKLLSEYNGLIRQKTEV